MAPRAPERRVGIVMITRNRREEAVANVQRLRALPERPQLVVVDNGSADGTADALRRIAGVRVAALPVNAGAAGRTLGASLLTSRYVAFADDDSWWEHGALARAADLLDGHADVAVVNAAILTGEPERLDPVCEEMAESPLGAGAGPGADLVSFLAGASVLRRGLYLRMGGFEPRLLIGGEEELLATDLLAAGWRIVYAPEVVVHHHASRRRDAHDRRALGIRNTLWTTWLRRPAWPAARRTVELLRVVPRDRVTLGALLAALRGMGWVVGERRVVPPAAEAKLRCVEATQLRSKARRYVS